METLPFDLWQAIFSFARFHEFAARCVCRTWCRRFPAPVQVAPQTILDALKAGSDPAWLLETTADRPRLANGLLRRATGKKHWPGLQLAWEWGAYDLGNALCQAARAGWLEGIAALKAWALEAPPEKMVMDNFAALVAATEAGQLSAMKKLTTDPFTNLVYRARHFEILLPKAAAQGHTTIMLHLVCWGARNFGEGLEAAARRGQLAAMRALLSWGTKNFDAALRAAAEENQPDALRLLVSWGAQLEPGPSL